MENAINIDYTSIIQNVIRYPTTTHCPQITSTEAIMASRIYYII